VSSLASDEPSLPLSALITPPQNKQKKQGKIKENGVRVINFMVWKNVRIINYMVSKD